MRETTKVITLNEESYRLHKLDVFSGSYLLKFLVEKCLPIMQFASDLFGGDEVDEEKLMLTASKVIPSLLSSVSEDDIKTLIVKCLNSVDKSMEAGYQPVMDGEDFGIDDIEYDMVTCLALCWQEIVYNCKGFFVESGWDFSKLMKCIILPHTPKTSTNAPLPR